MPQEKIIYAGLHTELEEELLADIAYWGFERDKLFFEKWELVDQIREFLTGNLNADKTLNSEAVLNAIAMQQGIFVERAEDIYSFSHLTLQEYLTAKYIVDNQLVEQSVEQHITDKRWKEVFILVAGLAKGRAGADPLLLAIEKSALNYTKTPTGQKFLVPWMAWAVKATMGSKSNLSPTAKRSVAIANAFALANAHAKAYANTNSLTLANAYTKSFDADPSSVNAYMKFFYTNADINAFYSYSSNANVYAYVNALFPNTFYGHAIANTNANDSFINSCEQMLNLSELFSDLDFAALAEKFRAFKYELPYQEQPRVAHLTKFACLLIQTWLDAFRFPEELTRISNKEIEEIDRQYFYPYNLILDCMVAAIRVSKSTWQAIEGRMFLPPED